MWPPLLSALVAAAVLWLGSGCSLDIFDVEVELQTQKLAADFGPSRGNLPDVTCQPDAADPCAEAAALVQEASLAAAAPYDVTLAMGCDARSARCYAQAAARLTFATQALTGDGAGDRLARRATSFVRAVDVAYTVPINTLTFDVPAATAYVGPPGTRRETDPGVVAIDALTPLPASAPFEAERHLSVEGPARNFIEQSVKARRPFVFVVVVAPRIEAGAPIPAGALEVDLAPRITVGLPR